MQPLGGKKSRRQGHKKRFWNRNAQTGAGRGSGIALSMSDSWRGLSQKPGGRRLRAGLPFPLPALHEAKAALLLLWVRLRHGASHEGGPILGVENRPVGPAPDGTRTPSPPRAEFSSFPTGIKMKHIQRLIQRGCLSYGNLKTTARYLESQETLSKALRSGVDLEAELPTDLGLEVRSTDYYDHVVEVEQ